MFDHLTPKQARAVLAQIRPYLVELVDVLGQTDDIQQSNPTEEPQPTDCEILFPAELSKDPLQEDICAEGDYDNYNLWYGEGAHACFECVFRQYGLSFEGFGDNRQLDASRLRAILNGYLQADNRFRELILQLIMDNPCQDLSLTLEDITSLPSVLDRLLGDDVLDRHSEGVVSKTR